MEVYGAERFAALYGTLLPIPAARVRGLDDGASFALGDATLRVHHTAGHAWHHFVVDDPAVGTVYTGDSFGLVYPALQRAARFAFATTSPTGFDAAEARRSIDRILALGEPAACLTHYDEVRDLDEVAAQLRHWIDLSEKWVEEAAQSGEPLATITAKIEQQIRVALAEHAARAGLALGADDWKLLALDIELNSMGLAVVADKRRHAKRD
jgi:glyoxylase-like metal-dependent hydrolase (beta-lactamase superfamily II)